MLARLHAIDTLRCPHSRPCFANVPQSPNSSQAARPRQCYSRSQMIQDFSPSSIRTPTEDSFTPTGRGTRFRSISGERCATDTCSFGALAWSTSGASTFRFSRPKPQASARWWAASTLRGVACSSPIMRASPWRRSSQTSRSRWQTSEGRSWLYHPVSTTAALSSCQTRRAVLHSRSRSVLSMSLRERHHRERFGVRFPGARSDHALQRAERYHFDAKIPPHDVNARQTCTSRRRAARRRRAL